MVKRFAKGEETACLAWLEANPLGFVWNIGKKTFHRAKCRCIFFGEQNPNEKTKAFTPKVCASTKDELLQVLNTETKGTYHHCSVCNPEGS